MMVNCGWNVTRATSATTERRMRLRRVPGTVLPIVNMKMKTGSKTLEPVVETVFIFIFIISITVPGTRRNRIRRSVVALVALVTFHPQFTIMYH
jgi:hypothetical protein